MTRFRQFGAITKIEDQDDGTIKVWGVASSETRDQQGETITATAMRAALPDYGRFPALREMHEPSAAGRVVEAEVNDHGITQICAHVVDPLAITKVRSGVYAGFSIGGKVLKRDTADRSVITALKLVEISLVDSPCNPDAVINMWKADMEYVPTSDEVVAKARQLAEDAGSRRYKDFLFKARERLIAAALASELDDGDDDRDENRDPEAGATHADLEDDAAADPDGGRPDDQDRQPLAKPKAQSPDPQAGTDEDDADRSPDDAHDEAPAPKSGPAADSKDRVKRVATNGDAGDDSDDPDADKQGATQADTDRIQAAHDHLVAPGAQCCKENCGDADLPSADAAGRPRPQDAPAVPDPEEDTEKLQRGDALGDAMMADLAKRFGDTITALNATIGDLTKRLEQVEAEPAAPRTAIGPLRAVSKAEDASPNSANGASAISADELKKVIDALPEQERGQFLLRIALSNPTLVHAARAAA
ncbi:MAG TPA: HK97 family phage prohead protease [Sphingomonas sp.]|nr:HK97 family phage prohead protease [Sphingomonas sp.]